MREGREGKASGSAVKFSATLSTAVGFLLLMSMIQAPSALGDPVTEWPKTFAGYHILSTEFADLDMDGEKEVIIGLTPSAFGLNKPVSEYTHVEAYKADGRLLWSSDPLRPYVSSPGSAFAVGEVDGDGYPEIVLSVQAPPIGGDHSAMFVLDHNGKVKRGWPVLFDPAAVGQPMLADLDKDGVLEIIFSHPRSALKGDAVSAYKGNGALLWTKPSPSHYKVNGMAVGDVNHDGKGQEIVVSYGSDNSSKALLLGKILVLDAAGSDFGKPFSKDSLNSDRLSAPVLGDLDGDGDLEISVCAAETRGGTVKVHAFRYDGTSLAGFPKAAGKSSVVLPSPVLADITADKTLEIFVFTESAIYAWNRRGESLIGWPVMLSWDPKSTKSLAMKDSKKSKSPEVTDLKSPRFLAITNTRGNDAMEVLFTSRDSILQSLNADGSQTVNYPTRLDPTGAALYQTTFGELGADHDLYMGASTTNGQYADGKVFLVKMDARYNPKGRDWPMAGHDLQLTGKAGVFTNPPVFSPAIPASQKIKTSALFTYVVQAKDPDGDNLTYAAEGRLPVGASFDPTTRVFRWIPQAKQSGTHSVVFLVSDGVHTSREQMDLVLINEQMTLVESTKPSSKNKKKSKDSDEVKVSIEDKAGSSKDDAADEPSANVVNVVNAVAVSPQLPMPAVEKAMANAMVSSPGFSRPKAEPMVFRSGQGLAASLELFRGALVARPQIVSVPRQPVKTLVKVGNATFVPSGRYVSMPKQSTLRETEEAPRLVSVPINR